MRLNSLVLVLTTLIALGCKARHSDRSQVLNKGTPIEILADECLGSATNIAYDQDRNGMTFKTPSQVINDVRFVSRSLRHFRGLELMVKDSSAKDNPLCANKNQNQGGEHEIIALDIGSATKLVLDVKNSPPQRDPERPYTVRRFEITSIGGIKAEINGQKFGCPGRFTFWGDDEKGLYDGVKITEMLIDDFNNGMSEKRLKWMYESFCVELKKK